MSDNFSLDTGSIGTLEVTEFVLITGSMLLSGTFNVPTGSITASLFGTASYANNADLLDGIDSTRFATTGSNTFTANQFISGTLFISGVAQSTTLTNVLTYDTANGQVYYTANALSAFTSSVLEYYVDKRFSGSCGVTINSSKQITSTNANYLTQLSASKAGDPRFPWPDPWSAALVASASIAAGSITNARVIIKSKNEYAYGSSTLAQNGDMTGSLTNNLTPDIAVSQTDYNTRVFDLLTPNVEFYFEPGSSLYNINKSWQQELIRYTSSIWDIAPEFKITGKGKFVLVYGENQGFICRYGFIAAPRAEITIEADHMIQNMWQGWTLHGQKIDIDVDKWWSYSSNTLTLNSPSTVLPESFWNWPSASLTYPSYSIGLPIVNVNINEARWGEDLFGGIAPPDNDYWTNIGMGHPYGTSYNVNIKNLITRTRHTDGFFRVGASGGWTGSYINNIANININYASASIGRQSATNAIGGQFFIACVGLASSLETGNPVTYNNFYVNLNVNKFDSNGIGLGNQTFMTNAKNSTIKIHCDDYRNYREVVSTATGRPENPCIFINFTDWVNVLDPITSGSINNNQAIISGNYRNYSTGSLIAFASANRYGNDNTLGNTLILDNFKGYQMNQTRNNLGVINVSNWSSFWSTFVYSTGSLILIKDSMIYATGSTPLFAWNNNGILGNDKIPTIILDSLSTNKDISGSFNYDGTLDISENVGKIIY